MEQNIELDFSQYSVDELKEIVIKRMYRGTIINAAKRELENRSIYLTTDEINQKETIKKDKIEEAKKKEKSIKDYWKNYNELIKDDKKFIHFTLINAILSLVVLVILANKYEDGNIDAIGMYVVVFLIPILIISSLNAALLFFASKSEKRITKRLISLIPIFLLALLSLFKNLVIPYFDGNLSSISIICLITIGITNIFWNILITLKSKNVK
jgi:hypothetical protein